MTNFDYNNYDLPDITDPQERGVIYFYALVGKSLDHNILQQYATYSKLTFDKIKLFIFRLEKKGYLCEDGSRYTYHFNSLAINPIRRLTVLISYAKLGNERLTNFITQDTDRACRTALAVSWFICKLVNEKQPNIKGLNWLTISDTPFLTMHPCLTPALYKMDWSTFQKMIKLDVEQLLQHDLYAPGLKEIVTQWQKKHKKIPITNLHELTALYEYLMNGTATPMLDEPQSSYGWLHCAIRMCYEGSNWLEAFACCNVVGGVPSSICVGIFDSLIGDFFYALTTLVAQSACGMPLKNAYSDWNNFRSHNILAATYLAKCICKSAGSVSTKNLTDLAKSGPANARCLALLLARIMERKDKELPTLDEVNPRCAILRYELSAYKPIADDERRRLEQCFGPKPLLTMLHCRQPWDEFFDNIDSVMTKIDEEKVGEAKKAKRIVYFMDEGWNQVAVCEQTLLKTGRWGMARDVKLKRFLECSLPSMDDFDRRLAKQARWQTLPYLINIPIEAALPMLADSNRLFTGQYNNLVPVKVTHEKPCLIVQKLDDGIKIVPNYMLSGTVLQSDATDAIFVYQSPTHYVIYDLDPKLKKIYDSFAAYDDLIPASEEKRIHRLLDKVKDVVDVFSSDFDEGHSLETVDGDARLVLQARPTETGFTLHLCVRPLTAGRLTFAPGKGEATVVDEVEGRHLQVKRDLKAELANLEVFETFADSQEGIAQQGDNAMLDIESMLELLAFAPGETKSLVIEWPEGEKLRLREPKKSGAWGVGLRHHGGWFEPEGTVELSDESLVAFADLIRSLAGSRGRFVRLAEGDYIRLDKNIRRKLDALDAVTVESRGSIQMSTFGAALLPDELFEGDLSFGGDSRLEALRARISSAESEEAPVPEALQASLRDYQIEGYRWIARLNSWGAGACLADDMGLGKTVQAIAYLLHTAAEGASLVVAPASVIHNWRNELARFAPSLKVVVLNECADRNASLKGAEAGCVVVVTYGLLVSESKALTAKEWNTVVLDEAHTIKNRDTKMSTSAMKLKATRRLILTGTPVQNRLGELWNLFRFINPGLLGSYDQFKAKFITPIEELQDKERQAQLNRLVHPFMLRRTKREVVAELPDKEEITLRVELSEGEEAVCELIRLHAEEMLHAEESDRVGVATLAEITRLRQAACSASLIEKSYSGPCSKIAALLDLLAELQEGEHRALIFSQFTSFLAQVRKALDDSGIPYLYLDGSVPPKQRAQLVKEFQEGSCPFFLISLKAGGLGLNLTAANYVVHLDPWWNPAIEQQATDRAYRIGQTQKVTAYHLVAAGTIEEKILRLHETKRNLADALLDGTDLSSRLTARELMELLEKDARED